MSVFDLDGRKALITGSARGLGQGMAEALSRAGAAVMITDVLDELGEETAQLIGKTGATAGYTHLDVTDEASWEAAVAATVEELGGLDILINNAGLEISALVSELDADNLRRMLDVNVVGTALGMKHGLRAMRPGGPAGDGGSIINIASVAALIAFPGIAGYSGTKSAVDRMTRIAAAESGKLGYGVRVNCVFPGLVPTTPMGMGLAEQAVAMGLFPSIEACAETVVALTPSGRLGEIPDIADAVVFLASDASRFVNGTGLAVDGGMGS
jgi:NAD(P)-dependent dehydrogenase (short-subunit alcohol dehydrogenase family)